MDHGTQPVTGGEGNSINAHAESDLGERSTHPTGRGPRDQEKGESGPELGSKDDGRPNGERRRRHSAHPKDANDARRERTGKKQRRRRHSYTHFHTSNEDPAHKERATDKDGRLNLSAEDAQHSGWVAKALGQTMRHHIDIPKRRRGRRQNPPDQQAAEQVAHDAESIASSLSTNTSTPRLNIVIMVIGSRGDIQPFLKVGKILKHQHGHRVRIATHPTFRDFVQNEAGLEFFSIGGDPSELMAFMVKNPGLIPKLQTFREGEIKRRRESMAVMFDGFWRACINATDDETDRENLKMLGDKHPFVADAIIANPPSMAHVHIAEKLGIPLHMMFTFPYSPTQQFPHPVANIQSQASSVDAKYVNFMSYPMVETMTWQGLGDIVNRFREKTLGLDPVSSLWAPGALYRMKVPYTYLWSPSLVPKPKDWGPEIDIAGFVFLDLASDFKPGKELEDFMNAGEPPVYIGFGSIVIDDPNAFTDMIFEATKKAGVRALVNKGWGGLGNDGTNTPDHIFMLGNTPHDWLFPRVKAVVHHGGAGTTAIGLKCGKPTMIVPFFGDQPFWGAMVAEAKAGAHECIPFKKLDVDRFAEGIKQCLTEEAQTNVQRIADSIEREGDGAENAVTSFHRSLPLAGRPNMRCSILDDRVAVWRLRDSSLRLSALAAELLVEAQKLKWADLKLIRHYEWNDFDGPGEPLTGTVGAVTDSLFGIGEGVGMVPVNVTKHIRHREGHERKKRDVRGRREERKRKKAAKGGGETAGEHDGSDSGSHSKDPKPAPDADGDEQRPQAHREDTTATTSSTLSADPTEPLPLELAGDLGTGLKHSGAALLTMPNDLLVAIAQGFHNAPRLWGDVTVRKPVRITGWKSGCIAARHELVYGLWDGWTGLVMQPLGDWRDADSMPAKLASLGSGVGKGVGGFVLKNLSAVVGPPAYLGRGVVKYVEKRGDGPGTKNFIRRAHIMRGQQDVKELQTSSSSDTAPGDGLPDVRARVAEGWKVYEEVWQAVHQHTGPAGRSLVGRYRMHQERRNWEANGALDHVDAVSRALEARKEGRDLDALFAVRRREMREAERPREAAMGHSERHGDEVDNDDGAEEQGEEEEAVVLPNRHRIDDRT